MSMVLHGRDKEKAILKDSMNHGVSVPYSFISGESGTALAASLMGATTKLRGFYVTAPVTFDTDLRDEPFTGIASCLCWLYVVGR
jgi:hypothetical protein